MLALGRRSASDDGRLRDDELLVPLLSIDGVSNPDEDEDEATHSPSPRGAREEGGGIRLCCYCLLRLFLTCRLCSCCSLLTTYYLPDFYALFFLINSSKAVATHNCFFATLCARFYATSHAKLLFNVTAALIGNVCTETQKKRHTHNEKKNCTQS